MIAVFALAALQAASPLDALFGQEIEAPVCSVTLHVDVREVTGGPTERQIYRYDRVRDGWTYVSKDGEAPPEDERAGIEEGDETEGRRLPAGLYAEALSRDGLDWAAVPGRPGTFVADDLPDGEIEMNGRDVSDKVRITYEIEADDAGTRLVSGGAELKKRWRIPMIARIDDFSVLRTYAPAADETGAPGAMLPTYERLTFRGDVMGGEKDSLIETRYTDWDCVPANGEVAG